MLNVTTAYILNDPGQQDPTEWMQVNCKCFVAQCRNKEPYFLKCHYKTDLMFS